MEEQSRPRESCQSHIYWKVNVKPALMLFLYLFCFYFSYFLPASPFLPLSLSHTHTNGCPSLWKEPAGSSLSRTLFVSCSPHLLSHSGHQTSSLFLSLRLFFLSPILKEHPLIPRAQTHTRLFSVLVRLWISHRNKRERECKAPWHKQKKQKEGKAKRMGIKSMSWCKPCIMANYRLWMMPP